MLRRLKLAYRNSKPLGRYYLRELGLTIDEIADNYAILKPKRLFHLWHQRRKYGFDERVTWSLDSGLAQLIYERLRMFKEIGGQVIDLDWDFYQYEWEGKTYTLLGIIDLMLEKLEFFLTADFEDEEGNKAYDEFLDLYKLCRTSLWW